MRIGCPPVQDQWVTSLRSSLDFLVYGYFRVYLSVPGTGGAAQIPCGGGSKVVDSRSRVLAKREGRATRATTFVQRLALRDASRRGVRENAGLRL